MTDQMIAQANAAIKEVEQLIQQADWVKMKGAAEKVTEMTLTDQQRTHADALYNLADLATFYRGGIVKGMETRQTASTFELTEGVPVLVVEASETEITIRANARNRTYTLDEMPFSACRSTGWICLVTRQAGQHRGAILLPMHLAEIKRRVSARRPHVA